MLVTSNGGAYCVFQIPVPFRPTLRRPEARPGGGARTCPRGGGYHVWSLGALSSDSVLWYSVLYYSIQNGY